MDDPQSLLLCTDMDRTVIPNGVQPESAEARSHLAHLCDDPRVTLVYVTGRHRQLVEKAIQIYKLPTPNYVITDVGTRIYQIDKGEWLPFTAWEDEIQQEWGQWNHLQLRELLRDLNDLQLQETSKQNTHKLSYYISLYVARESLFATVQQRLIERGVEASLTYSVDEPRGVGLLDILPKSATKLHAIEFLREHLGRSLSDVVFAGDSGNDLPVMASKIPSVLVANAADEIKQSALQQAQALGNQQALYLAQSGWNGMNGNYSAGLLEGVCHFRPEFQTLIEEIK